MSVIINNMEKPPHNCYDCDFSAYYVGDECHGFCILTKCWMTKEQALSGVHASCPVLPDGAMSSDIKQAVIDEIDITDWYSLNKRGELVSGAESYETALYKAKDVYDAVDRAESNFNNRHKKATSQNEDTQCSIKNFTKYIIGDTTWYGEADGYADGELVYDRWYCGACGHYFEEWEEEPTWDFCPICGEPMTERGRRKRR